MVYHILNIISKNNLHTADIYCKEDNNRTRYHLLISLGSNIIYEIHYVENGVYIIFFIIIKIELIIIKLLNIIIFKINYE